MTNPVLVEIRRGDAIESWHRGALAVLNSAGETLVALGDTDRAIYPRSAIKPLQAIPLVESGAAHRFALDDAQISLACASHGGEPMHVLAVQDWLHSLSLDSSDLACGAHTPLYAPAAAALLAQGRSATALHNNCSGKHAGFLTLTRHFGAAIDGYIERDHAAQLAWRDTLRELADDDLSVRPRGVDGCGIPVIGIPLRSMALAMARFADPRGLGPVRSEAVVRIQQALTAEPLMMAGTGRLCTETIHLTQGRALIKTGAEGVYAGAVPASGLGIALKIDDGNRRAADCAIATVLRRIDALHDDEWHQLQPLACPPIENVAGMTVGSTEAAQVLSFSL
ncbi:MAG: asparaginase [Gammaproteobacteria bacterium]|nr:asparaginase [Gammaproteobacteria bacterium]